MITVEAGLTDDVLDALAHLLGEMQTAGVADPARVVRAALAAGEDAGKYPLLAWLGGVESVAILWAADVRRVLIVGDVVEPALSRWRSTWRRSTGR
jgi:hypothetical protein